MNDLLPMFEDTQTAPSWPTRPRALMSYAYASKVTDDMFEEWGDVDVVIDSGAFTVKSTGKTVDHPAYLDWLTTHAERLTFAFALDVIGDPVGTFANYITGRDHLEREGVDLPLLPTWHIGTSFDVLEEYCQAASYVAIGGAVPHYQKQGDLYRLCLRAHDIAAEHGTKLHGLGMTGRRVMFALPWASVDSSSWTIPARMPFLYLANPTGRLVSLNYGRPMPKHHRDLVVQYGGDPTGMDVEGYALASVAGKEVASERKLWGTTASARAYMYVEAAKRRATGHDDFHVYLASSPRDIDTILAAHKMGDPWHDVPTTTERSTTMSDPADEPDGITEPPADVVARLAAQASQADLEAWAYDEGLDPDDPTTVDAWTDYNVEQAERRAEDAEWARGCR